MAVATLGTELLVNTTTAEIQADADVAALMGGGFVVTWDDSSAQDGDAYNFADIKAQVFTGAGAAIGTEIAVNANTVDEQDNPGVVGLASGGFAVAFEDGSDATVGGTYITVRGFASNGSPTTGDLRVDGGSGAYYHSNPQPVILEDGALILVHGTEDSGLGLGVALPSGDAEVLFDLADPDESGVVDFAAGFVPQGVAALPGDRFVHVFQGNRSTFDEGFPGDVVLDGIVAQIRDADGNPVGPAFQANAAQGDNASDPSVATLADGRFVITWSADGTGGADVFAQMYSTDGASLGVPFLVNTVAAGSQGRPDVAALSGGGFVITWTDGSGVGGDASGTAIKARAFDADGVGDPAETLVNTATAGSQGDAHVAGLAGDRFVITWTDAGAAGGADVKAQVFEISEPPFECPVVARPGTQDGSAAANEVLTGPVGANTFLIQSTVASGDDRIANFETTDVFVTDAALRDGNGDGLITFEGGGLRLGPMLDDTIVITGLNPARGLRALGESCDGVFVYADAAVRPKGAIEGTLGTDSLSGDAGNKAAQVFFFDTALALDLGADEITGFGAKDLLVTTTRIRDGNDDGIIDFGANRILDLPGAGGTVTIDDRGITGLEFDGSVGHGGVQYFVYSRIGTPDADVDGLAFA